MEYNLDINRKKRTGIPEVIFCEGKTPEQAAEIFAEIVSNEGYALATRADKEHLQAIKNRVSNVETFGLARVARFGKVYQKQKGHIIVATGGTSDISVAEEATLTLEFLGFTVKRIYDVGVAGLDRILAHRKAIHEAQAIIAVAGMDGILPTVISGLTKGIVIGVPTPVGYGTGKDGVAALNTMLNSCSPGLVVVNIGNGFGAACAVAKILIK